MKKTIVFWIAYALVIVGAINWGLVAIFDLDVVELVFGASVFAQVVYVLVAISALYLLFFGDMSIKCKGKKESPKMANPMTEPVKEEEPKEEM